MGIHVFTIWNNLPPLSPSHPSESSQCPGPKHPVSCIEPGLVIYFTYGKIHVSYYSLKSSHPCLLPQSPKVCSLHLCLFCCLAYRVIVTIFLQFSSSVQFSRSVMSNSLPLHGLQPAKLLCPWNSPGKNTGVWMKLEPIIQSEVSQKEKHQYSILMHI